MKTKDPVCGMTIDTAKAKFGTLIKGKQIFFCSKACYDRYIGSDMLSLKKKISASETRASGLSNISRNKSSGLSDGRNKSSGLSTVSRNKSSEFSSGKQDSSFVPDFPRVSESQRSSVLSYSAPDNSEDGHYDLTGVISPKSVTTTLKISGMTCTSCAAHIEDVLKNTVGISKAAVNFAAEKAVITHSGLPLQALTDAVEKAGYKAREASEVSPEDDQKMRDKEMHSSLMRFVLSFIFGMPLLYLSVGEMFELTSWLPKNYLVISEFVLASLIMIVGIGFFTRGIGAVVKTRSATMDTLVALGTGTAYVYSLVISIVYLWKSPPGVPIPGLYFEVAGLLIVFILLGRYLESRARGKTSEAIKKLMGLQPTTAIVIRGGVEQEIKIENVMVNDIVIVKPGQKIPVDGVIVSGHSTVDESMVTGESIPIEKLPGNPVIGGTINKNGSFNFKAMKVGKDTMLAQIVKLVENAQASKAPIQKLADRVSSYFVPAVMLIAIIAASIWYFAGMGTGFALEVFVAVLIIACPCAMGLATPTAVIVGTGRAAQQGILIKSAEALQKLSNINAVVFDKTGTLTYGKPIVTDIVPFNKFVDKDVLIYAAIAEKRSEHPLADAIVSEAKTRGFEIPDPSKFIAVTGKGVEANYSKVHIILGNRELLELRRVRFDPDLDFRMESLERQGKTVMIVVANLKIVGLIAVADTVRPEARDVVETLHNMGVDTIMITGDNERTAFAIASQIGIRNVRAQVKPEEKEVEVKRLQSAGKRVAMVGDGINDAPALSQADVGIAIGSGTDIAIESGDVVLVKSDVRDVVEAFKISKFTMRKIKQNLFWAFAYNTAGIPIAAGILYPFTGWLLNPIIAGAAMAFSSVSVVTNSLVMKWQK